MGEAFLCRSPNEPGGEHFQGATNASKGRKEPAALARVALASAAGPRSVFAPPPPLPHVADSPRPRSTAPPSGAPPRGGAALCACGGGAGAAGTGDDVRCAYSVWMDKDRPVQAYDVLLTERSRIIERNYRYSREVKNPRPEQDRLCLRCHSMDA